MSNTIRNITLKKIDDKTVVATIDDSLTCYIQLFYKAETIVRVYQESLKEKDQREKIDSDHELAFNNTVNNMHRLQKQMRAHQRTKAIYFSQDKSLTHYVFAKKKIKVNTRNVKETSVCNTLRVYHLYDAKDALSDEDFELVKAYIASL